MYEKERESNARLWLDEIATRCVIQGIARAFALGSLDCLHLGLGSGLSLVLQAAVRLSGSGDDGGVCAQLSELT